MGRVISGFQCIFMIYSPTSIEYDSILPDFDTMRSGLVHHLFFSSSSFFRGKLRGCWPGSHFETYFEPCSMIAIENIRFNRVKGDKKADDFVCSTWSAMFSHLVLQIAIKNVSLPQTQRMKIKSN